MCEPIRIYWKSRRHSAGILKRREARYCYLCESKLAGCFGSSVPLFKPTKNKEFTVKSFCTADSIVKFPFRYPLVFLLRLPDRCSSYSTIRLCQVRNLLLPYVVQRNRVWVEYSTGKMAVKDYEQHNTLQYSFLTSPLRQISIKCLSRMFKLH